MGLILFRLFYLSQYNTGGFYLYNCKFFLWCTHYPKRIKRHRAKAFRSSLPIGVTNEFRSSDSHTSESTYYDSRCVQLLLKLPCHQSARVEYQIFGCLPSLRRGLLTPACSQCTLFFFSLYARFLVNRH
jgi:hypothetical protein